MAITLRDYQVEATNKVLQHVRAGERKLLIVLATGLWKTTVFSNLIGIVRKASGKKSLILAHRDELLTQAKERVELMNPWIIVGLEWGENSCTGHEDVVVASVQTLGRSSSERIKKFNPDEFWIIVIDEAHHSTAQGYKNILEYFGSQTSKHPVILWVTATPNRADWDDLREVFEHVVCNYDIKYWIQNGYLSQVKAYTVNTDTDISEVGITAWDFKIWELGQAVNTEARNELVIGTYKKLLDGKKAIAFCVNVEHSKTLAEEFRKAGVTAESVTGDTPKEERDKIMEDYKNGSLQILCNCLVATEGFDAPQTAGVLLARPTKSESLFIQMAGRGLRLADDKDHVKLIDFVDNTKNNSIVSSSCFIWMKKPIKVNGENIFDYEEKFKQLVASNPFVDISTVDLDKLDEKIKEIDIFGIINTPEDIKQISKNSWQHYGTGYKISLGKQTEVRQVQGTEFQKEIEVWRAIVIQENALWNYTIDIIELTEQTPHFKNWFSRWKKKVVFTEEAPVKEVALMRADAIIEEKFPWLQNLIGQWARWKKQPPTEKQIKMLKKFWFEEAEKLDKGQASNLLSYYFDQKEQKKTVAKKPKKTKL